MKIKKRIIGQKQKPFIVAEMSGNHNQSLSMALKIVRAAAKAGVDCLKLQTYTPDTLTLNVNRKDFLIRDKKSLWKGQKLYNLYKKAYTPWKWHKPIFQYAKKLGLMCFSTPFDDTAVDFLEKLEVPAYKIASFENTDLPLIKKVIKTGKPIIISTGMASLKELKETVNFVKKNGCKNFALLKCTSQYPANPKNSNILTIPNMKKIFGCEIGISDHTLGIGASIAAVSHGASIIEKHFILNRKSGGVDSSFSLEPNEMKSLVIESKRAWESLGKISYGATVGEKKSVQFRRSLYIAENMKKGEFFNSKNLRIVRPGFGIEPKYYGKIIGKKIKKNAKKGTPVSWNLI